MVHNPNEQVHVPFTGTPAPIPPTRLRIFRARRNPVGNGRLVSVLFANSTLDVRSRYYPTATCELVPHERRSIGRTLGVQYFAILRGNIRIIVAGRERSAVTNDVVVCGGLDFELVNRGVIVVELIIVFDDTMFQFHQHP
ncbi:hypothetical protein N7532_001107 [Penicillium argentinense]|uniref:Uncharacterized protein n=1 Tax=Penicillium argentinense TaxID=1131581 RepID=A0A9W9G3F8_9EURO|nr:uncharacterized protein N7532_001107 [Penicillium argentinense]KAJ5110572.1 hypothetical protein N7532_001107 [Penicillium argentinense]